MTTYGATYRNTTTTYSEPANTRQGLGINNDTPGSLARSRTQGNRSNYSTSGSNYGSSSNQNQSATQARRMDGTGNYGNAMRNHVDVTATEVPGSKQQTVGNRVRVAGSNAQQGVRSTAKSVLRAASTVGSVAKGVSGAIGSRVLPGIGINAKGEIDFGLKVASTGVSISASGNVSLQVPGIILTVDPNNVNNYGYDYGFGLWSIESTQNGCDIVTTVRVQGKIISQQTRRADDCKEPEPTPEPTPTPKPEPEPGSSPSPYSDPPRDPIDYPLTPGKYAVIRIDYPQTPLETLKGYYQLTDSEIKLMAQSAVSGAMITHFVLRENGFFRTVYNVSNPFPVSIGGGVIWINKTATNGFIIVDENGQGIFCSSVIDGYEVPSRYYEMAEIVRTWNGTQYIYTRQNLTDGIFRIIPIFPPSVNPKHKGVPRSLMPTEDCDCELLGKIYDMLGGDTFYKNGLTIPNQLFIPDGKGSFKMKTYNEIMNIIFRTFSHRTLGEIEFTIEDANKGKEGNQKIHIRTINAQGYYTMLLKSISNLGYENTDQMNLLVRLGVVTSQLMKLAVIVNQNLKNVLTFFDMPTKDSIENVDIPFDMSLKGKLNRGFDSRADLQKELLKIVDEDTEQAIEGILDKFLNEWQMPVKVQKLRSTKEGGNFWYFLKQLRN